MLEIASIQLVTLPVYIIPLCKSTKRRLQSQVWFIYTGLMQSACFWYSKSGVKAKSVWISLLTKDPESGEANLFVSQTLPSQGRNDPSAVTCSCLLFLHLLSGYILTAVLWRSLKRVKIMGCWSLFSVTVMHMRCHLDCHLVVLC